MPSLNNIAPELLTSVLAHLGRRDVVSLLRVCKHTRSVCVPHLWYTLMLNDVDFTSRWEQNPLCKLAKITEELGADALGYKHIKKIYIGSAGITFSTKARTVQNGFQALLGDLILAGKTNLREVVVSMPFDPDCPDISIGFMRQLREYAEPRSVNEFSMRIALSRTSAFVKRNLLKPAILTELDIVVPLTCKILSPELMKYRQIQNSDQKDTVNNFAEEISVLAQLFTETINLRSLSIRQRSEYWEPGPISSLEMSEPLSHLQTALSGLKNLQRLVIGSTGNYTGVEDPFLHPSFFMAPPENCKIVKYSSAVSVAWWRKFSAYHFAGVEELTLSSPLMSQRSRRWLSDNEEEDAKREASQPFRLGSVAVSGLKKFVIGSTVRESLPQDLEACIYRENRSLDKVNQQKIRDKIVSEFLSQTRQGLSEGIVDCAKQVAEKYFEKWIGHNKPEDATAEKCLEGLDLERRELVTEFAQMLSSWIEKNIDQL